MKLKRKFTLSFIFLCALSLLFTPYCSAKPNPSQMIICTNRENLNRNDILHMWVKIISSGAKSLSHLDMQLNFDKDKLEFERSNCKGKTENIELTAKENPGGSLEISYVNHKGLTLNTKRHIPIFNLNFRVKKDAPIGKTDITAIIKNVSDGASETDPNSNFQLQKTLTISGKAETCTLKSLSPSEGKLNLPFDPNILDYSVDVPSDVKDITFNSIASDPDSEVKVSRHKLNAAGKTTNIKITVRNKAKKAKLIYNITVNRAAKPEKSEESKGSTKTAKPVKNKNRSEEKPVKKSSKLPSSGETKAKFYSDEELHENDYKNPSKETNNLDPDSQETTDGEDFEDSEDDALDESDEEDADEEDKDTEETTKTENSKSNSEPCTEAAPVNAMGAEETQTSDTVSGNFTPILIAAAFFTVLALSYSVFQISKLYFKQTII